MSTVAPTETLLGTAPAPLGLRVRGSDRDGQVVWLNSPKVTIGSDRRSTLRLRAPGVAPMHCLILCGSQQTIARRWSLDTRRNGSPFDETPLSPGDRLGIGPLEFEVVAKRAQANRWKSESIVPPGNGGILEDSSIQLPLPAGETPANESLANDSDDKIAALVRTARSLTARLKAGKRQARRRIRKLTTEIRTTRLKAAELERQLGLRTDEATRRESRQAEWDSQKQALEEERKQWLQTQLHIEQLLAELDRRHESEGSSASLPSTGDTIPLPLAAIHAEQQEELASLRATFDTDRQQWESQRVAWEAEFAQRQDALRQEADQLGRLQASLERQQSALERQVESLATQQQQLEVQTAELAEQRNAIDQQRHACSAELDQLRQAQAESSAASDSTEREHQLFAQQRAELAEATALLQQQQRQLEADRQDMEALRAQLTAEQENLRAERNRLDAERENLAATEQALASSQQLLQARQANLTDLERDLIQTRDELAQAQQELQAQIASMQVVEEPPPADRGFSPPISEITAEERIEPADAPDDVFARLRALSILKGDVEPSQDAQRPQPEFSSQSATEPLTPGSASVPASAEGTGSRPEEAHGEDEEESINNYMARLLNRVRGGSDAAADRPQATPMRAPGKASQQAALASQPHAETVMSFSEFEPRTSAPEKTRDLAAMREIANFTARTAIAKHVWRSRIVLLVKRFIVGLVALTCGIILMLIAPAARPHFFFCGMVAVVASLIWFLPSIYRAKRYNKKAESAQQLATADYENLPSCYQAESEPRL